MKKIVYFIFFKSIFLFSSASSQTPQEIESKEFIEVKLEEGTNMAAALSPNKKFLAIDLQGTIWIMPVSGGEAIPITDDLGDAHEPVWSPNGEYIAFHSYRTGNYHIWTIKKDGTELTQITEGIYDDREPSWSPDGKNIIFSSDRSGNYDIWSVNLPTREIKQLTTASFDEYNPAISPDGNKIAFVSEGQEPGIYVLEEGVETILAPSSSQLAAPSWSENNDLLSFVAYERGVSRLMLADLRTKSLRELSGEEDIFPFRASWFNNKSFLYTANGKIQERKLGVENTKSIPFNALIKLPKGEYSRKEYDFDNQEARTPLGIMGPAIAPDGKSFAFTALGDIYVQEIGGTIRKITNDAFVDLDPDWSPDGKKLAYVSDRDGNMNIYIHNIDSGKMDQLTSQQEWKASKPSWSPDGRTIAFYSKGHLNEWGSAVLKTIDISTGKLDSMKNPVFVPSKPTWSPDGETIGLMALKRNSSRFREGKNVFILISPETWETREVSPDSIQTPGIRTNNGPVWSPIGSNMAYIQNGVLMIVPVDQKGNILDRPRRLTTELAESPTWSGDGKNLLYIATDQLKTIELESGRSEAISIDLEWKPDIPKKQFIIHAGRLFNGVDSSYIRNVDIFIEGNRIRSIKPHQKHFNKTVVDASDKVVMPGLFEGHSHQNSAVGQKLGKIWLAYGITSVREPGADPYDALERKESWSSGVRPGPRLFSTGGLIGGSRIYYGLANSITNKDHLKLEMERAQKLKYDLIKTYVRTSDSLQKYIITAAHEMGIPVSSHEIYPAAKYKVDAVEHFRGTSRRGYSPKQSTLNYIYDDVIQIIGKSGMTVTPTVVMHDGFLKIVKENPEVLDNRQLKAFFSESYIRNWANREVKRDYGPNFSEFQRAVIAVMNSGGNIMAGTDSPFVPFGASLHAEMWLYVDGGVSPFQALQTASINAAKAVGVDKDLGSIEPGKLADLIIINGDPLNNIRDSWNIEKVIKGGSVYNIDELLLAN